MGHTVRRHASVLLTALRFVTGLGDVTVPEVVESLRKAQRQRDTVIAQLEHLTGLKKAENDFDLARWMSEESHVPLVDLEETLYADPTTSRILRGFLLKPIWDADENFLGCTLGTVGTLGNVLTESCRSHSRSR